MKEDVKIPPNRKSVKKWVKDDRKRQVTEKRNSCGLTIDEALSFISN